MTLAELLLALVVVVYLMLGPASTRERFAVPGLSGGETIFVSVASFRDQECGATVASLFAGASHPDRVFVGICQQNKDVAESCLPPNFSRQAQVRVLTLPHTAARGPAWARHLVSTQFKGEDFYFQVDSHTRFEPGWDVKLIAMLKKHPGKCVLSHYPPAHEHGKQQSVPALCKSKWGADGLPTMDSKYVVPDGRRVPFTAGGMLFMPRRAVEEVPFDPALPDLFQGEEILYSARLYTQGWDVHTPTENVVSHHYTRSDAPKVWQDNKSFMSGQAETVERVKWLLGLDSTRPPPRFMTAAKVFGDQRSLQEYWSFAGLNTTTKQSLTEKLFCP